MHLNNNQYATLIGIFIHDNNRCIVPNIFKSLQQYNEFVENYRKNIKIVNYKEQYDVCTERNGLKCYYTFETFKNLMFPSPY